MVAKRSSKSKSVSTKRRSVKRRSVKRSSVKRSSVKRSSKKRSSMKKRLALGAAGGLAALIAGREIYKREKAAKAGNGVAPSAKARSFFESLRARFAKKASTPVELATSTPAAPAAPVA